MLGQTARPSGALGWHDCHEYFQGQLPKGADIVNHGRGRRAANFEQAGVTILTDGAPERFRLPLLYQCRCRLAPSRAASDHCCISGRVQPDLIDNRFRFKSLSRLEMCMHRRLGRRLRDAQENSGSTRQGQTLDRG